MPSPRITRTLIDLIPETSHFEICVVLRERAAALALESRLPESVNEVIRQARPYVEGRGMRPLISRPSEIAAVIQLISMKLTPKSRRRVLAR